MVVIDAGSDNGAKQGMKAVAYGSILIGHIAEVFPGASKIKLVSYPGEETNLIIENAKISAIGLGLGGGNIEVKIPGSVKIISGDKIKHRRNFSLFTGNGRQDRSRHAQPLFKNYF